MTEKLKNCPICGRTDKLCIIEDDDVYAVNCDWGHGGCGTTGGYRETEEEAIELWNTRSEDKNPPLTLDELRKMYRNPIWIQGSEQRFSGWAIVGATFDDYDKQVARCADGLNISHYMKDYGKTWLAYRRKPEGGTEQ